jgi:hypothetical protein
MVRVTTGRARYLRDFDFYKGSKEKAFEVALKIRNLEYEMYWKRSSFCWVIVGAALVAFHALYEKADFGTRYALACLGFLFSVAWYLINRASAAWLRNWDAHVEILEDAVIGPLFKSVMNRRILKDEHLLLPFPFSPQRINNILALAVAGVWLFLMARICYTAKPMPISLSMNPGHISVSWVLITGFTAIVLPCLWRARLFALKDYPARTLREVRDVK